MEANPPYYQTTPRRHFTADANANPFPGVDPEYDIPSATALAPPHHVFHPGEHGSENDIEHIAGGGANGSHINHSLEGAHDLHGLVEAATTAANLAAEAMTLESSQNQSSTRGNNNHSTRGKRRRASTPTSDNDNDNNANANTQNAQGEGPNPRKRARTQLSHPPTTTDPQMQTRASSDSLLGEARAAGVHSAAALFRQASSKGGPKRKYTRPPMANLFMSLRLTPENFLQLQARAKAYMLDPAHPDRQSCVGNRGKGDNDMVKLKLFNCVRDFLVEGVGEQFFGEGVEVLAEEETVEAARALGQVGVGGQEERLVWPRDGNKIISLVTPLLRRMVTNERQRVYALQTRKGGGKKNEEGVGGSRGQSLELQTVGVGEESLEGQRVQSTHPSQIQSPQPYTHPNTSLPSHHYPTATADLIPPYHTHAPSSLPHSTTHLTHSLSLSLPTTPTTPIRPRALPTPEDRTFCLRKIVVTLAANGVKLKPTARIKGPGPLNQFSWGMLCERVEGLLGLAVGMYPELAVLRDGEGNWRGEADEGQRLEGGGEGEEDGGKERVALRRLAVAATEMEGHHHHHHSGGVDDGGGSKTVAVADDAVAALEPAPAPQTTTTSRTYLAQEHATRPPSEEEEPSSRKSLNAASESCTPRIMSNTPNVSESRPSLHPGQSPARLETDTAVSHSLEVSLASPFQHLQPSSEALPDAVPAPSGFADGLGLSELQLFNANANGHAQPQAQQQHQTPPQSRKPEHQPGAHTHNEPTRPTPDSGAPVVSAPPAALLLPRHVVSVLTTQGLTRIETAEEWECVKEHVGYAVWAEGRVSVVIEVGVGV